MNAYAFYEAGHTIQYNEQGVERIELLPGTHDEVKAFKIYMKAGSVITPELYKDSSVFYVFGHVHGGVGILKDEHKIYNLDTVCFYAPNYEHEAYSITAVTDFEFVQVIAHMDSHDWERAADTQLALPFFRRESECDRYDQDCKTPGTISRTVLFGEFDRLGRLTCGICEAENCAGTIEKGHPEVHQWDYALEGADYWMNVGSGDPENIEHYDRVEGDWDFIPAGPDHTLYAEMGHKVQYCWVEFNTHKRGK